MTRFEAFKQMMKKARKGQRICYHTGNLGVDRLADGELDLIARFCAALYELDTARLYHAGDQYFVTLTARLHVRKDDQGSFQEAERIMTLC